MKDDKIIATRIEPKIYFKMLRYLDETTYETPSSLLRRLLIRYLNKKEQQELELQQAKSKQDNDTPKKGGSRYATYRFG